MRGHKIILLHLRLASDHTFLIHHKNMHCSLVTVFKVIHSLTDNEVLKHIQIKVLQIIIFIFKLSVPSVNSTLKGPNSLTYYGAVI